MTKPHADKAVSKLQKPKVLTMGKTLPSACMPNQIPVAKAITIIKKPPKADAAPAACGKGPMAPLWPQGW